MPKRKADAISPPPDSGSDRELVGQPDEGLLDQLMAATRCGEEQTDGAAAANQPSTSAEQAGQSAAVAATVAVSPLSRLATVELQLIMRCCDQSTLIALARCSRFTLTAASSPFVWQQLSPIALQCDWPLELSGRLRTERSLLRHAEISISWRLRTVEAASAEQVAALAALPRLRGLTFVEAYDPAVEYYVGLSDEGAARLLEALGARIDHGAVLTSLTLIADKIGPAGGSALVAFIARSRTLTSLKITDLHIAGDTLVLVATALARCRTLTCLEVRPWVRDMGTMRALTTVVQHSSSLKTFKLYGLRCDSENVADLASAVAQSRSVTDLQLPDCKIDDVTVEVLVGAVEQSSSHIRRLDVSDNHIRSTGIASLARLLASGRCTLTSLNISQNRIEREGALALAEGLQTNRTLTELRLGHSDIGSDGIPALVSALQHNAHCRLRVLDLAENSISQPAAAALAELVRHSGTLERLEVNECSLVDEGMAALAAGIGHSHSLQHLDLSHNKFGAAGAAALAAAVSECPALTSLDVSGNGIGDEGLAALAPTLGHVRTLNLQNCGLMSGESLAWLIEHNSELDSLDVSWNGLAIGPDGVAVMAAALQPSSSLRALGTGFIIGSDGAAALADALRRGWRASELHLLSDSNIGDNGARALAAALEQLGARCTLSTLSLTLCGITPVGALALVRAVMVSPSLRSLDLELNLSIKDADKPALVAACGPQPHFELKLGGSA